MASDTDTVYVGQIATGSSGAATIWAYNPATGPAVSAESDKCLEEGSATIDTAARQKVYERCQEIVLKEYIHLGIAVDTEQGLIVPVIRDVDKKSVRELAAELQELASRTRDRKVAMDEMQGGSFTVSNQGGIGSGWFTPIINKPEVAILGVARGTEKMLFRKNRFVRRSVLPLSLSYDHRLIDGADAARFMVELVRNLESVPDEEVALGRTGAPASKGSTRTRARSARTSGSHT